MPFDCEAIAAMACRIPGITLERHATGEPLRPPMPSRHGPVAQWLEPAAHNRLVGGSSPSGPTISFKINNLDIGFSWGDIQGEHWFVQSDLSREVTMRRFLSALAPTEAATSTEKSVHAQAISTDSRSTKSIALVPLSEPDRRTIERVWNCERDAVRGTKKRTD